MPETKTVDFAQLVCGDLEHELTNTRRVLERVPDDKLTWRPHAKSYTLGDLALHLADMPWLFELAATVEDCNLANYPHRSPKSTAEILQRFDETAAAARRAFGEISVESLGESFTLRAGDHKIFTVPRAAALRNFAMNHMIHHRAQLSVYLRLLDIPVPGLYGPSADEQ